MRVISDRPRSRRDNSLAAITPPTPPPRMTIRFMPLPRSPIMGRGFILLIDRKTVPPSPAPVPSPPPLGGSTARRAGTLCALAPHVDSADPRFVRPFDREGVREGEHQIDELRFPVRPRVERGIELAQGIRQGAEMHTVFVARNVVERPPENLQGVPRVPRLLSMGGGGSRSLGRLQVLRKDEHVARSPERLRGLRFPDPHDEEAGFPDPRRPPRVLAVAGHEAEPLHDH